MIGVTALWLIALPLFDAVGVMLRRTRRGGSPFKADRIHYHHLLMNMDLRVSRALLIIVAVAGILAGIGVAGYYLTIPEYVMFYAFIALFFVYLSVMEYAGRSLDKKTS